MSEVLQVLGSRIAARAVVSRLVPSRVPRRGESLLRTVDELDPVRVRARRDEASELSEVLRPALSPAHGEASELPDTTSLFRRYAPYVAAIGMRILGRRDEIDDLVQDVFLSVHRHRGQLRDPGALRGWLARLAVHEATRKLKRRRLRAFFGLALPVEYAAVADAAASPEDRALLSHVFTALDALPAPDRVAWALRHLEGETMESVAELCGCSLSTAKRRVASAERALEKGGVGRDR